MSELNKSVSFKVDLQRDEAGEIVGEAILDIEGEPQAIHEEIIHLLCWNALNSAVQYKGTNSQKKAVLKNIFETTKNCMDDLYRQLEDKLENYEDILED